jgi:protein CpxP
MWVPYLSSGFIVAEVGIVRRATATFSPHEVFFSPDSGCSIGPLQGAPPMKRLLLSTSLALALSTGLAVAQQPDAAPAPTTKVHQRANNPQREAARLSKRLNLTSDQMAKLEPILVNRDQKLAALKNDSTISPVVMQQQMRALHQQTRQQLTAMLTPDQLQQIKSRHHGHGAPSQTPPQPNPQSAL